MAVVTLIDRKDLDNVLIRCQRLLLRLMRFSMTAEYAPGKISVALDTLSQSGTMDSTTEADISCYVNMNLGNVPVSQSKINAIRKATQQKLKLAESKIINQNWMAHTLLRCTPLNKRFSCLQ